MKLLKKLMVVFVAVMITMSLTSNVYAANTEKTIDSELEGPGAITINNANPDQSYGFYKLFDATPNEDGSAVSYKFVGTKPAEGNEFYTYFDIDAAGNVTITEDGKDATESSKLSAAAVSYLNANYRSLGRLVYTAEPGHEDLDEGSEKYDLTVTGLPYGYYYITTTTGTVVSVDTVQPDAVTEDKNPGTSVDKTITGIADGSIDDAGKNALAQIGTVVSYESRIPIANGAKNYVFTDTMTDGLTLNTDSVAVYLVEAKETEITEDMTPENAGTDDAGSKYGTLTATDATEENADITIQFNDAWLKKNVGKFIVVCYEATVNANAVISGTEGNPNTATINWGNTSDYLHDEDEAKVFSAKITVNKTDGKNTENTNDDEPLENAGFILSRTREDTTEYYVKNTDGIVSWTENEGDATVVMTKLADVDNPDYDPEQEVSEANPKTIKAAIAEFAGLADGTYTLIEKVVPSGFNKVADQTITIVEKDVTVNNTSKEASIVNNKGTELPSTGGIGTTIFHIAGAALVLGAGILLISKKRMNNN